ncbi:MAG: GreA/GreB family elongation factor [Salinivirgaceae bacterium]|nr:GreA/GreB family elongation factor [Salinivirgaceae bacterium]
MSRAFVKNDASDERILVPPRAPLPPGIVNYVTPRGMTLLREELAALEAERLEARKGRENANDDAELIRRLATLGHRIAELGRRIDSARVVNPLGQPGDEVRFGATVTVRTISGRNPGRIRRMTIVGVDEAEPSSGFISFISPLASILIGGSIGETVSMRTGADEELLEIEEIDFAE